MVAELLMLVLRRWMEGAQEEKMKMAMAELRQQQRCEKQTSPVIALNVHFRRHPHEYLEGIVAVSG